MYDLPRKKKLNKIVIRKHQNFVFFPKLKKKKIIRKDQLLTQMIGILLQYYAYYVMLYIFAYI